MKESIIALLMVLFLIMVLYIFSVASYGLGGKEPQQTHNIEIK